MSEAIQAINLEELEALARELLPQIAYDYYASGANDEITLRENRAAYERLALLPRMLVDVSARDMRAPPSWVSLCRCRSSLPLWRSMAWRTRKEKSPQ